MPERTREAADDRIFLPGATPADWEILLHSVGAEPFVAGQVLIEAGDAGDCFFILAEGDVRVLSSAKAGGKTIATIHAGSVFGEIAFLDGGIRTATVSALTDGYMLRVSREAFVAIQAWEPQLAHDRDMPLQCGHRHAQQFRPGVGRMEHEAVGHLGVTILGAVDEAVRREVGIEGPAEIGRAAFRVDPGFQGHLLGRHDHMRFCDVWTAPLRGKSPCRRRTCRGDKLTKSPHDGNGIHQRESARMPDPGPPQHPLEGHLKYLGGTATNDGLLYLAGALPACVHDACHMERRDPRSREASPHVVFRVVVDGRVLDPGGTRVKTIVRFAVAAALAGDGTMVSAFLADDVRVHPPSPRAGSLSTLVEPKGMKEGAFARRAVDAVLSAIEANAPAMTLAVAGALAATASHVEGDSLPAAEASVARMQARIAIDGGDDFAHRALSAAIEKADKLRGTLGRTLEASAAVRRRHENSGGIPTDQAQRAAQRAARVIEERVDASARARVVAAEATARREERDRARAALAGRQARLAGVSETLLALVKDAVAAHEEGSRDVADVPGGWDSWLERAKGAVVSVEPEAPPEIPVPAMRP